MISQVIRNQLLEVAGRRTPRPRITGANRILLHQPDHLGDIILSEPAVRLLRDALPDAELIAVVGPWSAEIAKLAWPVDRIFEVEYPGFTRQSAGVDRTLPYRLLRSAASELRKLGADDAVVLRDDAWWAAWLARASSGRHIIASDDKLVRPFATVSPAPAASVHRTAFAVSVISALVALHSSSERSSDTWDMSPRIDWKPSTDGSNASAALPFRPPFVVLHPGSGAAVKSWPASSWRAVLEKLDESNVVLTGSAAERTLCESIAYGFDNATVLAGDTSLGLLAHLLSEAILAIGTDSGPLHLAGALGTPTVRLYGPSNPARYGPWPGTPDQAVVTADWDCPKCGDLSPGRGAECGCMAAIEPEAVIDAVRSALSRGP